MKKEYNDITEEAEETNVPEAKQVEALDFHSKWTGSSPVGDTKIKEMKKNWFIVCNIKTFGRNTGANDIELI